MDTLSPMMTLSKMMVKSPILTLDPIDALLDTMAVVFIVIAAPLFIQ
jgi:hypothetical protein